MQWRFLKIQGIKAPYDPAILLLGIHTEETKIEKDTYILLFTATLLTITRTWKQPRCSSTYEWIKKLWYIYKMESYSAIERNTSESVLMRWMNLEPIIQSEVSQKEKDKYCILMHIYHFPGGSDSKASVYNVGYPGSIPGLGRSSGEGNGSPLQHSCLENPMDRGA